MKELHYNVTGQDRKELVGIISKVVGMKAVYQFMPTCAFVISNITVEKDGTMVWDERTDQGTIEAVIVALAAAGFNPVKDEAEETRRPEPSDPARRPRPAGVCHRLLRPLRPGRFRAAHLCRAALRRRARGGGRL